MIKEEKNIDFYTSGRQLSDQEFARISKWIKKDKEKKRLHKSRTLRKRKTTQNETNTTSSADSASVNH